VQPHSLGQNSIHHQPESSLLELPHRSEIHWARKIWHMGGVFIMFLAYQFMPFWMSLAVLMIAWFAFVPADLLRQNNPVLNRRLISWFKPIIRKCEIDRISGSSFLISGVLIIDCLFSKEIVSIALLFLAFADPIASFFGIKFGKHKIFGHKSLEGSLAAYVVCVICSFSYLYAMGFEAQRILYFSLVAGFVGAVSELMTFWDLDDNFTLPIFSSIGMLALMYVIPLGIAS
jgi:diacylglycerol kinase (CTP)